MLPGNTQELSDLEFVIWAGDVATAAAAGASRGGLQTILTRAWGDSTAPWLRTGERSTSGSGAVGECRTVRGGESDSRDVTAGGGEADSAAASAGREAGP